MVGGRLEHTAWPPGGGDSGGKGLLHSSIKIGFTNHSLSFPIDSSISHEQWFALLATHWVELKPSAWAVLGAESVAGWDNASVLILRFKEESQKSAKNQKQKRERERKKNEKTSSREF